MEQFAIELKNIHKSFGKRKILSGMDLHVKKGETLVILGPSGTGKSVTLKHITGLLEPDAGDCFIFGESISRASPNVKKKLRARMGVLFQSGALINWLTVFDNVALPLREHKLASKEKIQEIVMQKLKLVDMVIAKDNFPNDISGGMKKRVGIARAITTNPEIILYDEPTSGLDPVMSNVINELVLKIQKETGAAQIVVTHDMSSAYMIADRISFVYKGKIVFTGTPKEIQNSDNELIQQFIQGKTKGPMILESK
ncbi:ABC transporter ATP-binding protein [Leptospira santarosai]|uniref:ABC transporter, ATP-binding protein n=1 Tax=Leptospira santarosai str. MOR084 TaxID=1049984 RepID=A0A0E2B9M9_9LEPT|nr:ABC transporter ATP-binding protein [Leptospira santarosai]EKO31897.1 ABC transporter, ATP-binding protein [Leptospira santarosai str. MOR084]EMJ51099.1 ABC transporter, ATP-binding protein [Leptospira santarosai str. HAI1349]EMO20530.1 ABC transporter, ATP-binding protein [Leptospira santarosai str. HAI134]EMP79438.1 ABC transporter, ATP-binding protein [Leptospira santarosai str. CBC1531]MDI7155602.1 ABC transporter ATP-binding protein [Leptospira santarosai]